MATNPNLLAVLRAEFDQHISLRERSGGIVQVVAPIFHEDGDMIDIFIDIPRDADERLRISDHGMTLMRLSYSYEIDTDTKRKIFDRILSENGISDINGRLTMETAPESIYRDMLQFAQAVAKVSNMQAFKREVVQSLFYETLNDFVGSTLVRFHPQSNYAPPMAEDYDVDWRFPAGQHEKDLFLYGVKDTLKARLAVASCLKFKQIGVRFRSVIVHEDFTSGGLSKKDKSRITNVADKQFSSLEDFKSEGEEYFDREILVESTH